MSIRHPSRTEREQLPLFRALPGDLAPRDAQDLMAYPFFSLAKTHRTTPIDFRMNEIAIRVEAVAEHGMATIWDADVLIWAASQIVEARDAGLRTSRLMAARPREILTHTGRGTGARDYHRLKAALDRLQSTTVATSLRQISERRMHRFSWINEWTERADAHGNADGIDLIVPDWFYRAVLDDALVLTIDGRRGTLALSHRPQACRPPVDGLAVRVPASSSQIGEPVAVQTVCLRAARHRSPTVPSGVQVAHRTQFCRKRSAGI
jgi:plasmid replication initiation protein